MSKHSKNPSASRGRIFEELKEYIFIAIISGILSILIALPFVILYAVDFLKVLPWAFITGILVGTVSRTIFVFVLRNIHSHPFWAFLSIFFIMGIGTFLSSYFFGLSNPFHLFLMVSLSEVMGLTVAYLVYRYSLNLNQKLMETQKKIQQERNKERK